MLPKLLSLQGDLASRNLVLESKRFYLDVKENQRGRFIKIAEISADGRKNQVGTCVYFDQYPVFCSRTGLLTGLPNTS